MLCTKNIEVAAWFFFLSHMCRFRKIANTRTLSIVQIRATISVGSIPFIREAFQERFNLVAIFASKPISRKLSARKRRRSHFYTPQKVITLKLQTPITHSGKPSLFRSTPFFRHHFEKKASSARSWHFLLFLDPSAHLFFSCRPR